MVLSRFLVLFFIGWILVGCESALDKHAESLISDDIVSAVRSEFGLSPSDKVDIAFRHYEKMKLDSGRYVHKFEGEVSFTNVQSEDVCLRFLTSYDPTKFGFTGMNWQGRC